MKSGRFGKTDSTVEPVVIGDCKATQAQASPCFDKLFW
jgi:hypothetical protein